MQKKVKNHNEFLDAINFFHEKCYRFVESVEYGDNSSPYSKGFIEENKTILLKTETEGKGVKRYQHLKIKF